MRTWRPSVAATLLIAVAAGVVRSDLGAAVRVVAVVMVAVPAVTARLSRRDGWTRRWLRATVGGAAAGLAAYPFAAALGTLVSGPEAIPPAIGVVWYAVIAHTLALTTVPRPAGTAALATSAGFLLLSSVAVVLPGALLSAGKASWVLVVAAVTAPLVQAATRTVATRVGGSPG